MLLPHENQASTFKNTVKGDSPQIVCWLILYITTQAIQHANCYMLITNQLKFNLQLNFLVWEETRV